MGTASSQRVVRLAVIGCGAVAKENLLPVLSGHRRASLVALVDQNRERAQQLARAYGVKRALSDGETLTSADVDGVVLATPPAHHAPAAINLINRGLHVFVEKPMATRAVDAQAMVQAADEAGLSLAVGLYRRMLPSVRMLASMIRNEDYGRPLSIDIEEGGPYGWALATLDVMTPKMGGGGVLIDIGSHVLDLLLFLTGGRARLMSYRDNSRGGVETDCVADLEVDTRWGLLPSRIELSRTRELRGSIRIECQRGTLELLRGNFLEVGVTRPQGSTSRVLVRDATVDQSYVGYEAFRAQFDTWFDAIETGRPCDISGDSVLPVVELIEECYKHRSDLREPCSEVGSPLHGGRHSVRASPASDRPTRRVLVTGAGGFLGGRTVDLLRGCYGWAVAPLIKEPRSAARLARWPDPIVLGDVCSISDMERAVSGCEAVVHCAVGTSWDPAQTRRVTVEGTRIVAEAARRAGVKRFVHISSMFVHKRDGAEVIDERTALKPPAIDSYGRSKLDAERMMERAVRKGLSAITLRPTRIYGPFSKTFTTRPLQALRGGRLVIGGDPEVPANMVYVDNVVAAIAAALEAPATAVGQAFLINDQEQVSLRSFYEAFADSEGATLRVGGQSASADERENYLTRLLTATWGVVSSPEARALVHRIMDTDLIGVVPRKLWNSSPSLQGRLLTWFGVDTALTYRGTPKNGTADLVYVGNPGLVSSARARAELGWSPCVSMKEAIEITRQWARYARLLPPLERSTAFDSDAEPPAVLGMVM